jgi:hypothetical protein
VGPDSELLYSTIEKRFGREKLESLYVLLADFYVSVNGDDAGPES